MLLAVYSLVTILTELSRLCYKIQNVCMLPIQHTFVFHTRLIIHSDCVPKHQNIINRLYLKFQMWRVKCSLSKPCKAYKRSRDTVPLVLNLDGKGKGKAIALQAWTST
jgi:hypothetical protein